MRRPVAANGLSRSGSGGNQRRDQQAELGRLRGSWRSVGGRILTDRRRPDKIVASVLVHAGGENESLEDHCRFGIRVRLQYGGPRSRGATRAQYDRVSGEG